MRRPIALHSLWLRRRLTRLASKIFRYATEPKYRTWLAEVEAYIAKEAESPKQATLIRRLSKADR